MARNGAESGTDSGGVSGYVGGGASSGNGASSRRRNFRANAARMAIYQPEEPSGYQAELFYLQKQIQSQTPMVIVMEDGETIEGTIEWYDRDSLKVRGKTRMLIYKDAIKYMYKQGENG